MLIMDTRLPLGLNKSPAASRDDGELDEDQEPTPMRPDNLRDLVALGSRRARSQDDEGSPSTQNKRSRTAASAAEEQQAQRSPIFQEEGKFSAEEVKLSSGADSPSPLVDMVVNVEGVRQTQMPGIQASLNRSVASAAAASSGEAMGENQIKDLTGAVFAANAQQGMQDPSSLYGLNLPGGGVGGGTHAAPASGSVAAPAGLSSPSISQFQASSPSISQFQAAGGMGGNPMFVQPGSAAQASLMAGSTQPSLVSGSSTQANLMPFAQPEPAGAQQQYLQGYLSGLQQAKAANTSQQTMVGPQGNFPHGAVGAPGNFPLGAGFNNSLSNSMGFPFNPAAGAASGALSPTPLMPTSFPTQASFAASAQPQGLSSLGSGFSNAATDPLLGAMINPSIQAQAQAGGYGLMGNVGGPPPVPLGFVGGASAADGFPLTLPQALAQQDDSPNLTNHQILLRHQIEVFEASEDDANTHTRGRNKPIMIGQVGVRCKHCKNLPVLQRQKGSTYFPNSLLGLYQAAQNMNTVHMQCGLCTEMPEEVKGQFVHSMCYSKVHQSGAGRHYWARSAKKLGLVDTEAHGIRFIRNLPQGAKVLDTPSS